MTAERDVNGVESLHVALTTKGDIVGSEISHPSPPQPEVCPQSNESVKKKHCDYLTVNASKRQIVLLLAAEINDDEFVHLTLNPVTIGLKTAGSR